MIGAAPPAPASCHGICLLLRAVEGRSYSTFGKSMNITFPVVMYIALMLAPAGITRFEITGASLKEDRRQQCAALLSDGYWKVTSKDDSQGHDYRISGAKLISRTPYERFVDYDLARDIALSDIQVKQSLFRSEIHRCSL